VLGRSEGCGANGANGEVRTQAVGLMQDSGGSRQVNHGGLLQEALYLRSGQ
jgi:hypothetical protein